MKKIISLLLCSVLLCAVFPFAVNAVEVIDQCNVTVTIPANGAEPNDIGIPDSPDVFTVVGVNWYPVYDDDSTGMLLFDGATFETGQKYRAQAKLQPCDGYAFSNSTEVYMNGYECIKSIDSDGFCYVSTDFYATSGKKVTVTFDSYGFGMPKTIELYDYQCVWDGIDNDFEQVRLHGRPGLLFWDWTTEPFSDTYFDFYTPITEDMTLYPIWHASPSEIEFYLTPPCAGMSGSYVPPFVYPNSSGYYMYKPVNWWDSEEGARSEGTVFSGTFAAGETYYTKFSVHGSHDDISEILPEFHPHGCEVVDAYYKDWAIYVIVSVTVPSDPPGQISNASVHMELPRHGDNTENFDFTPVSLVPGLEVSVNGIWTNPACMGETFSGEFETGTDYYVRLDFSGNGGNMVDYSDFTLDLSGGGKVEQTVDLASWYSIPNIVGAIVSFKLPGQVHTTLSADEASMGMICTTTDFNWEPEKTILWGEGEKFTAWAKDGPDSRFVGWYSKNGTLISTKNPCTFEAYELEVIYAKFVPRNPFVDVAKNAFYYDAVLWAVSHTPQVTNGTDETHFSPKATCTRGQVVTFLWRAFGAPEPISSVNPFKDVKESAFYYKAVLWAVEKGITKGIDATHFGPDKGCTRGQVVSFLWRAEGEPLPSPGSNPFTDVKEGKFYYGAVQWANQQNITNGTDATHFSPDATCTRGQIVTFLMRDILG
ncbi:MAG: S-layer homology domain-containing protein [Clostridia bacterium]|nr:S-layer homology domain-containing protein [Clostridia bacterium]